MASPPVPAAANAADESARDRPESGRADAARARGTSPADRSVPEVAVPPVRTAGVAPELGELPAGARPPVPPRGPEPSREHLRAAAGRLGLLARFASRHPDLPVLDRALDPDTLLLAAISNVWRSPTPYESRKAYLADLDLVSDFVERAGPAWLERRLRVQAERMRAAADEFLNTAHFKSLHAAAKTYLAQLRAEPQRDPNLTVTGGVARGLGTVTVDDPALRLVLSQQNRKDLLNDMATSEKKAQAALEGVFHAAAMGMSRFLEEMAAHPDHLWRYPPVVIGALADARLIDPADPDFARFMVGVARLRARSEWDKLGLTAGLVIAAAALVAGPAGLILLSLADAALSAVAAWQLYRREEENDIAEAASLFSKGDPITNRRSDYGPVWLTAASGVLSVLQLHGAFAALRAEREALAAGAGLAKGSTVRDADRLLSRSLKRSGTGKPPLSRRVVARLDEWAAAERGVVATSVLGTGEAANAARALYRFVRKKPIPGITAAERQALAGLTEESWALIVQYADTHRNVYVVKGNIAEHLIPALPEFEAALKRARALAAAEGFPADTLRFTGDVKGLTVSAKGFSGPQLLTDRVIVAIEPESKVVRLYAVFEAKSPSNARELATRLRAAIGQLAQDYERIRELPIIIAGETYAPGQVIVSRQYTEWIGVVPPGVSLTKAQSDWIRQGLPTYKLVEGAVGDSVLNYLAAEVLKLLPK